MGRREKPGTGCNVKCCIAIGPQAAHDPPHLKDRMMSQQLTLSSLFCVLALAGLCVVTGARDLTSGAVGPKVAEQAELSPGLLQG
jgi:hypothetical protein